MSVFLDTSALYAAMVRNEERHRDCAGVLEGLLADGARLHTTSYVVLETVALLQHRIGIAPVRDLTQHVFPLLTVCWVTGELHHRGMRRLLRENRRDLSLTDCVSFEYMAREGLRQAFSLDGHFAEAGFQVVPV